MAPLDSMLLHWLVSSLRTAGKAQAKLHAAIARDGGVQAIVNEMRTRAEPCETIGL
ncbi:MAG: hypothetical protein Q8Q88_06905 [Phenylobacterium sp.]|uniref:hypothetical protein n=1 Tax=Phenylobacterium sp. TaxID=1871053 RepID=UPI00273581C2|nr:hypothetical protein [Phenylobacterium sp.]MDP3746764.1 hypothetical protein [Phenylobacterium sp.]